VVLQDIIEFGVLVDKDVDGLVAHELHLLARLLSHLLSRHRHNLTALPFPSSHSKMEVTTHGNLLYFHVYFAQQVIGCYLFISIAQ
jgi:hypothetical protein